MSYFIKTGFWEKAAKGPLGWLNLDRVISDIVGSSYVPLSGTESELTDASTIDIDSTKVSLVSSSATRTFTISSTADDITMEVVLNNTAATYTFPSNSLCVSEGIASGDNLLALAGVSGDHYIIGIKNMGTYYYVVCKNFGQ